MPAGSGRIVLAAGAAFVATWSLGAFYQAFGPSVTAEYLQTTNPLGAIVPFIAASLVVGVAQGAASTGGIRVLLVHASQQERAGLLSTIYLISYSGAAIPSMIAGELTSTFDLFQIALAAMPRSGLWPPCLPLAVRNTAHG